MTGRVAPLVVQRGRFDSPFFRSKFRMPNAPDHFVRRPRLVELLDDLSSYPVTALVAPAGSGKTALVADWVHGCRAGLRVADAGRVGPGSGPALRGLDLGRRDPRPERCRPGDGGRQQSGRADGRPASAHRGPRGWRRATRRCSSWTISIASTTARPPSPCSPRSSRTSRTRSTWCCSADVARPSPIDRLRATGRLADVTFDVLRFSEAEALGDAGRPVPGHCARRPPGSRRVVRRVGRRSPARRARRAVPTSRAARGP